MQAVKTAISIEKNLFDQAEAMARRLKVSRSKSVRARTPGFL